jgi:catechol 2,3-dioxygenase-like lactoylglutathione lyase family enzyme
VARRGPVDGQSLRPAGQNIGLHHLSLSVADDAALDAAWQAVTAHREVMVDAAPGPIRPGSSTRHFLIFIPGGIRLEFATPFA